MRYPRNSNGYPHIFDDARTTGDTADIVRRQPTTVIQNRDSKPEVECFSVTEWDITEISMATPTGNKADIVWRRLAVIRNGGLN